MMSCDGTGWIDGPNYTCVRCSGCENCAKPPPPSLSVDLGITYATEADETYTKDKQLKNAIEVTVTKHITDIHMYYSNNQEWHICAYIIQPGQTAKDKTIIAECDGKSPEQALSKLLRAVRI